MVFWFKKDFKVGTYMLYIQGLWNEEMSGIEFVMTNFSRNM